MFVQNKGRSPYIKEWLPSVSVYIKRGDLIGRYGVITPKTQRLHMYKRQSQADVKWEPLLTQFITISCDQITS